jgi:dienelactone hydrolase
MNGGRGQDWADFALLLANNGYASLAIDMRGHGQTGGSKDWELAADDVQRVWNYFTGLETVDGAHTAVAGASIGSSMALDLATREPAINTIVLLSPGLNYFGVSTDDRIVEYGQRPALIVASEEDSESAESSRALRDLAPGLAELVMYQGAGHGTSMFARQEDLSTRMLDWLNLHVKGEQSATAGDLPASTLFESDWDDRSPYRDGLISSEVVVLDQTPGASVYHMDLTISPDLQSVSGQQQVRYTNQEEVDLQEVYFHLFPNLLGGEAAISNVTLNGNPVEPEFVFNTVLADVSSGATKQAATVMGVPLDTPLAPGEQVVIGMDYEITVPAEGGSNYGVFAAIDDVLALAHFYPQIAVYDEDGWHIDLPPANADVTFADVAYYQVRVTAPAEQVLVASGVELDKQEAGDQQIVEFAAGPVRDYYIASSDGYTVISDMIGETTVNSYAFPEFAEQNEGVLGVTVTALESFGNRFGDYPFTEFEIAPTPNLALGVEYPGVVVIRSALYDTGANLGGNAASFYTESATAHEVGHQWFYSVVGNDQLNDPWLDESLTQYATYLYHLDAYGPRAAESFSSSFAGRWDRVGQEDIVIGLPAGEYEGSEYSGIVYGRGPLFFIELAEEMGEDTFNAFLRDYYQQNKWGIATGPELKSLAEKHCACDLSGLFAEWVGDL